MGYIVLELYKEPYDTVLAMIQASTTPVVKAAISVRCFRYVSIDQCLQQQQGDNNHPDGCTFGLQLGALKPKH